MANSSKAGFKRSPNFQDVFRLNFLGFSLLSVFVFGAFAFWSFFNILKSNTMAKIESELNLVASLFERYSARAELHLKHQSADGGFLNSLEEYSSSAPDSIQRFRSLAAIERHLSSHVRHIDIHLVEIAVAEADTGLCIFDAAYLETPIPFTKVTGKNLSGDQAFYSALRNPVTFPFEYDQRLGLVTMVQSAPVEINGATKFVLIHKVDVSKYQSILHSIIGFASFNTKAKIFTMNGIDVDPKKEIPQAERSQPSLNPLAAQATIIPSGTSTYVNEDGQLVLGSFKRIRGNMGIAVVELPYVTLASELQSVAFTYIITILTIILILIFTSSYQARRFSRPVTLLVARCKEIAEGDWDSVASITGILEFELLGNSFNAMARDISTSFGEREKITRSLEEVNRELIEKNKVIEESERRYRDLYERSQDGLFSFDIETNSYTLFNRRFCEILGYTYEEMQNIGIEDIIPIEERAYAEEQRSMRLRGEHIDVPYELYVRRKDGEYRYVEVFSQPAGANLISGSVRDVTDRVMLEKDILEKKIQLEKLNESLESLIQERTETLVSLRELHEKIISNAPLGVMVISHDYTISYVNEQMAEFCGKQIDIHSMPGLSVVDFPDLLPDGMLDQVSKCFAGSEVFLPEIRYLQPVTEEMLYLDFWAVPLFGVDSNIEGALVLTTDQTNQVRLRSELTNSTRLAATGQLAASLAHEINNPLNSIRYNIELAKMDIEEISKLSDDRTASSLLEYLRIINREIDRIGDIVRNLLDLHRAPTLTPIPFDINSAVSDVLILMKKQILEEGVKVETNLTRNIPDVSASAGPIKQIIINIMLNALFAVEKGGKITVETGLNDKFAYVSIEDNGPGIPPDILPHIFEPFYSTKGVSGVGLGLAVCESIVNQFRGKIDVESAPGNGAKFTVHLPIYGNGDQ